MTQAKPPKRKGITCCCTTDHGGLVLEGYALATHKGHRIAGLGHRVYCPKCKGIFPIVESTQSFAGYAPAVQGMRTACGARLIGMFDDLWVDDDSGLAHLDVPPSHAGNAEASTPPSAMSAKGGVSHAAFETARDAQKVHVTLRIGIGNDGTGNNFSNSSRALALCSPEALKLDPALHPDTIEAMKAACRTEHGMSGASYDGGETNVHRLFNLYKVTRSLSEAETARDGRLYVYRNVYVQGVGTLEEHPDSVYASSMGYGATGVIARAEEAIEGVIREIHAFVRLSPDIIIDAIEFDLWGFSRGAAASRHLAWLISHGVDDNRMTRTLTAPPAGVSVGAAGTGLGGTWIASLSDPFKPMEGALLGADLPLKEGFSKWDLKICFIGLFDCVAAIGVPSDADNDPVHLDLSKAYIGTVVHLAARDECRLNFASNPVKPYNTILLPGVHSDIGGGYAMRGWEHLILGQPETSSRRIDDRLPPSTTQSDAWRRAFTQMSDYGWSEYTLLDNDGVAGDPTTVNQLRIACWTQTVMKRGTWGGEPQPWQTVTAAVTLKRMVRGEYQLVTLRIMYELAKDAGVPFSKSPDDVPELTLPAELIPIYRKLLAYARADGRGKNGLTPEEERLLSRRYLHQSANWNPIDWKPAGAPEDKDPAPVALGTPLFVMRPAPYRKRNVFDPPSGH
jgi:type VI secretion system secreted protein VgrG